jgi:predicted sulfurtransferase
MGYFKRLVTEREETERHFFNTEVCDRCRQPFGNEARTMSRFNTDTICMPCKDKERAHPDYKRAEEAELAAVRSGDYNFPGIGKPADL